MADKSTSTSDPVTEDDHVQVHKHTQTVLLLLVMAANRFPRPETSTGVLLEPSSKMEGILAWGARGPRFKSRMSPQKCYGPEIVQE